MCKGGAMTIDVIIIGAGASGLYLASQLKGLNVHVFEKNQKIGIKILATGSGQCNLTHDGYINRFYDKYGDKKTFVKSALSAHDNHAVMQTFKSNGLALEIRGDGKVFPKSLKAADVVETLRSNCAHVTFRLNESVTNCHFNEGLFHVTTEKGSYTSKQLVIATGGKSYPKCGTTGDGYNFAAAFGHYIEPTKPGLTGVVTRDKALTALSGISLTGCVLTIKDRQERRYEGQDLLFTHFGISGPLIINNSRYFDKGDCLTLNFLGESRETIERTFNNDVRVSGNKPLAYYLNNLPLPHALKEILFPESLLNRDIKLSQVNKEMRKHLLDQLTQYVVEIESLIGFSQAMVTVGGVATRELDPKTMASKLQEGLYVIGEVMDVDGDTGGYNLQWAFSSAYVCAQRIKSIIGGKNDQ
jgi:hypothetical protein